MLRVLLFSAALASGGGAAWMALAMQVPEPQTIVVNEQVPVAAPTTEILVAAADLAPGQKLSADNVRWQPWPEAALNGAYVTRSSRPSALEELQGSMVRNQLVPGEPVREDKLAPADSNFLSAMLPSGKRAVAVRVSAENTAGGFILPNDRVDVLHTLVRQAPNGEQENFSRAILTNVRILAIDQTAGGGNPEAVVVGKTATLELDAQQTETVVAAEASGLLSLALRSSADAAESQMQPQRIQRVVRVHRHSVGNGAVQTQTTKLENETEQSQNGETKEVAVQ